MTYIAILVLLLLEGVNSQLYGNNTVCPSLSRYEFPKITSNGTTHRLEFAGPVLMQKILIDTHGCDSERQLIEGAFSVAYIDASDASYQQRTYSEGLSGMWDLRESTIEVPLGGVLYTEQLEVISTTAMQCSRVYVHGCTTSEICHPDTCKNGGTCIGNGNCACAKGFMGDDCASPVADMTFDNYDIVAAAAGLLFTTDAPFDVTGDVSFTIDGRQSKRSGHHHGHHSSHGNSCHFHGHGGSCHYSSSHTSGYSHGHHSTYGHSSSHSASSCMNGAHSYTHSCQHSHGHGHDHNSLHYLYSTHGSNHHSHGASLHYHNHQLHLHVHDHHHHNHHYVTAPYNPLPGLVNHIVSCFSPHTGASIIINGNVASHQTKPTVSPPTTTTTAQTPTTNSGLCFGSCGVPNQYLQINSTISNMVVAGASVPTLTQNTLLGMLGNQIANFLINQLLPQVNQHAMTTTKPKPTTTATTTPKPTTTAATTQPPKPTAINVVFTKAPTTKLSLPVFTKAPSTTKVVPTTLPRITATSPPVDHGPICHDCLRLSQDGNCTTAMQCSKGDVCLAMHDRYGYTHRCISKQDCDHGTLKATADCWYCCTSNLCNDQCNGGNASSCQDDPQCASLRNLGAFYDVCSDPALSTTTCQKTCKHCP